MNTTQLPKRRPSSSDGDLPSAKPHARPTHSEVPTAEEELGEISDVANPGLSSDTTGSAILVNVWVVWDGYQQEFVETIVGLFEYARTFDGFIAGEVLRGANPTRFVSYLRMRSAEDRQRVLNDSEVAAFLRTAERIARPEVHTYDVLHAFGPSEK